MKTTAIREAVRRLRAMNLYTLAAQVDGEAKALENVAYVLGEVMTAPSTTLSPTMRAAAETALKEAGSQ
jgi:hypothetical protein